MRPNISKEQRLTAFASLVIFTIATVSAQGGVQTKEDFYTKQHVERLPADIRNSLKLLESACGAQATAAHYFSTTIDVGGLQFRLLHFENFACADRTAVCRPNGCLHEVFLISNGRSKRVFRAYARDLELTDLGGVPGLIDTSTSSQMFRWNGRSFDRVGSSNKDFNW